MASDRFHSDDGKRGIFSTGAVALPLVVGGALGAHQLYRAAVANGGTLFSFAKRGKQIFEAPILNPTLNDVREVANPINHAFSESQQAFSRFYTTTSKEKVFNFRASRKRAWGTIQKMLNNPEKHGLLSASIQNSKLAAASTAQQAAADVLSVQPVLSEQEMRAFFNRHNPLIRDRKFLKQLNSNLSRNANLKDMQSGPISRKALLPNFQTVPLHNTDNPIWKALKEQQPKIYDDLRPNLKQFSTVEAHVRKGNVLRLKLTKAEGGHKRSILLSMIDPATGEAWSGKNLNIRGAGRNIHDSEKMLPAHEYMMHHLTLENAPWTREYHAQLKQEQAHSFIFSNREPLDSYDQIPDGKETYGLTDTQIRLRSEGTSGTVFPRFDDLDLNGNKIKTTWKNKSAEGHLLMEEQFHARDIVKLDSDGSLPKNVRSRRSLSENEFDGLYNPAKPTSYIRANTKDVRMANDPRVKQHTFQKVPMLNSKRLANAEEDMTAHSTGMNVAGVSSMEASLFGDLPNTVEELHSADTASRFRNKLVQSTGMSQAEAAKVWARTKKTLIKEGRLAGARDLGRLGEGSLLIQKGFGGKVVETEQTVHVTGGRLSDAWVEHYKSNSFSPRVVLGRDARDNVQVASAPRNYIKDVTQTETGWTYRLTGHREMGTGAKLDFAGWKGEAVAATGETAAKSYQSLHGARRTLNTFREAVVGVTGSKTPIHYMGPEINSMALTQFTHDKVVPYEAINGAANSTLNSMNDIFGGIEKRMAASSGQNIASSAGARAIQFKENYPQIGELLDIQTTYLKGIAKHGITHSGGQFHIDHRNFAHMTDTERAVRSASLVHLAEDLMASTGQHIKKVGTYLDPMFTRFKKGTQHMEAHDLTNDSFMHFQIQNSLQVEGFAWNHATIYPTTKSRMTMDMQAMLHAQGDFGTLKDFREALVYPKGSSQMAAELMHHIHTGDFSKPFGPSMTMAEAFPKGTADKMKTPRSRLGSVFDPDHEIARSNYSIEIGEGDSKRYMPVLGHDAFAGKTNQHGDENFFSHTKLEGRIRTVEQASPEQLDAAESAYHDTLGKSMFGKSGVLRAQAVHPLAETKNMSAYRSELRNVDGSINPFQVHIGEDTARRMKVQDGHTVMAARHPVSSMQHFEVKIDKRLNGTGTVGFDQSIYSAYEADNDGDKAILIPHEINSSGHKEAMAAIDTATHSSDQQQRHTWSRATHGAEDDISRVPWNNMEDIGTSGRFSESLAKSLDSVQTMKSRTTSTTVGRFSNLTTRMDMQLAANPWFHGKKKESFFMSSALWQLRQAPIAAGKNSGGFTAVDARNFANDLTESLNGGSSQAAKLHNTIVEMSSKAEKPKTWIPEMLEMGIPQSAADAKGKIQPITHWLEHDGKTSVYQLANTRSDVDAHFHLLTSSAGRLENPKHLAAAGEAFASMGHNTPYLQGSLGGPHVPLPNATVHSVMDDLARATGASNELTASAKGGFAQLQNGLDRAKGGFRAISEKANQFRQGIHGDIHLGTAAKFIGAGVALAAVAGFATTRASFDTRKNSNSVRPEEAAGAQDYIPSEPATGSRSPSQAPRNSVQQQTSRVALVAPVHSAVNVDVNLRAENRQDGVEKMKLMAQMMQPGRGGGNMTVINRDATRTNSLRFKSQMRDQLNRDN